MIQSLIRSPLLRPLHLMAVSFQRRRLRGLILAMHGNSTDPEIAPIVDYLRRHPEMPVPLETRPACDYVDHLSADAVKVEADPAESCPFVMVNGDRIYFPTGYGEADIRRRVNIAFIEQHPQSPHLYVDSQCRFGPNATAVLAGASDGIFALSIRDRLRKGYLFEPNADWHRPLALTIKPFGDKFEIVPKFLSDHDAPDSARLDAFMKDRGELDYLQADVEGGESALLAGAMETLRRSPSVHCSICSYHNHDDARDLSRILESTGLKTRFSQGYFVMGFRSPYLRRAIIYGWK
ncbi:MAG TPA: FkbM family methyltransferase [Tepidisphaeraceae bacterium]|jgi:hypothetical protein